MSGKESGRKVRVRAFGRMLRVRGIPSRIAQRQPTRVAGIGVMALMLQDELEKPVAPERAWGLAPLPTLSDSLAK